MTPLAINEIFETIQGEATFTGTPSVFVRLQGCRVGCPWCDTKHTWAHAAEADPTLSVSLEAVLEKRADSPTFALVDHVRLANLVVAGFVSRHIVITGGEPCEQESLPDLTGAFLLAGRSVQIETSGTSEVRVPPGAWVTLSPKIGMPGGRQLLDQALERANEIKMPVGKPADIDRLSELLDRLPAKRGHVPVWLQPLSQSQKATDLCVDAARINGWSVSFQVHKYANLR